MAKQNTHKIYQIREFTTTLGEKVFRVFAADSWLESKMGLWTEYTLDNRTVEEAKEQIAYLKAQTLSEKGKIVYQEKLNN